MGDPRDGGVSPQKHPLKNRGFPWFSPSTLGENPLFFGNTPYICKLREFTWNPEFLRTFCGRNPQFLPFGIWKNAAFLTYVEAKRWANGAPDGIRAHGSCCLRLTLWGSGGQSSTEMRTEKNQSNDFLVGGFNPVEKYESKWESSPSRGEKKQSLKPPPSFPL